MGIPFRKVQGTGNDFVLVDGRTGGHDWGALAVRICDRHFGVGADGVLVIEPSKVAPVRMRIYNADGSEAEMCGNGLRCFIKHVVEEGIAPAPGNRLRVATGAGVLEATLERRGTRVERVRVAMGTPVFRPREVPVVAEGAGPITALPLPVEGVDLSLTMVSMGNPHAVHFCDGPVAAFPLETVGPLVEHDAHFPGRTNFEIVNVLARDHLRMRVWERGAGLTLACGTGACAALVAARLHQRADARATVSLPGGDLIIEWDGAGPVYLEGPAVSVFSGEWES